MSPNRLTFQALVVSLIVSAIPLLPRLNDNFLSLNRDLGINIRTVFTTSMQQRRLSIYGDKKNVGYGYLQKIVEGIPDPNFFPLTRYPKHSHETQLYLSDFRSRIDDRLLVGIDITTEDLKPSPIPQARLINNAVRGDRKIFIWGFTAGTNYDKFMGFRLHLKENSGTGPQSVKITLFDSPDPQKPLGSWTWDNQESSGWLPFMLETPLTNLGLNRESLPFMALIEISSPSGTPADVEEFQALGVKVDLSSYVVFHHEENCFAAIKRDFLMEVQNQGLESWQRYITGLKNV